MNCVRDYYAHYNAMQLADSSGELLRIRRMLHENKLGCSAIDCHGLFGRSSCEYNYTCEYLEAGMRIALELGAPLVVTSIPKGPTPYSIMARTMKTLCQKAADLNLGLAIEAEYDFAVGPNELEMFLNDVAAQNLYVNFDPSHFARCGWKIPRAVEKFRDRIAHVHLKEYLPDVPHGTRYSGIQGSPCSQMLDELGRLDYDGIASAETLVELDDVSSDSASIIMNGIRSWETRKEMVNA